MDRVAVFPGSFDPITLGHLDIIERAVSLFDKIIVAIGTNSSKNYMFSLEQRIKFIEDSVAKFENVEVMAYKGLTVDLHNLFYVDFVIPLISNLRKRLRTQTEQLQIIISKQSFY